MIKIITVGKLKEKYLIDATLEYKKRITKFSKIEIIETKELHAPDKISNKDIEKIKEEEGNVIKKHLKKDDFIITLCIEGKLLSSEELANKLRDINTYNSSNIVFIIGGSFGISDSLKEMSKLKLSFSKMTFPHQLMRVILLEQVYRAYKINNNETYHK